MSLPDLRPAQKRRFSNDLDVLRMEPGPRLGLVGSGLVHAGLFAILALLPQFRVPAPPPERSIAVEILSPQQFSALSAPDAPPVPVPLAAPLPEPSDSPGAMIEPTTMLAASVLADPRNRSAREGLTLMTREIRAEQLCGIEALEQITVWRAELEPEQVFANALKDPMIDGPSITAEGAAFFSHGEWISLEYRCEVAPDFSGIASFAFRVGNPIAPELWDGYNLPLSAHDDD